VDSPQQQFNFNSPTQSDGYNTWQQQRREALRQLARKMGLPLERKVEVWLQGDIRLVGVLRLREEQLFVPEDYQPKLELLVGNVPFTPGEMLSCVALD
jgi:hypothetical protein